MVTSGPGATNAITGSAGAWLSSTPVLFISGQVKTAQMGQINGLRGYGLQEIAIVSCVKPITKYAVTVMDKNEILYHLQKALFLANDGRKGPVWIDIPLDIQGDSILEADLSRFIPENDGYQAARYFEKKDHISSVYNLLNSAKRPAILVGHGVVAAKGQELVREFVEDFKIPLLTTWRSKGIFGDDEEYNFGSPGIPALRYSNYVLQNADFLLIIGTRLNPLMTAYNENNFAPNAKKIIVDIDGAEINKLHMDFSLKITADAYDFLYAMRQSKSLYAHVDRRDWLKYCNSIRAKYPLSKESQPLNLGKGVNGYKVASVLSYYSTTDDVFVGSSSGRTCGISHMAYEVKRNQRFVSELSLGSMGWTIPAAIGACIASGRHRTLLMEGDGSLQHNLQELQLIRTYKLPLKIFIYENGGYASIYSMQRNNFKGRYCGCDVKSGLSIPRIKKIAELYKIPYYLIISDSDIDAVVRKIMSDNSPCICEIQGGRDFDEIPKSMTIVRQDGSLQSSLLEDLYPFVSEKEQKSNMPKWDN